MWKGEPQENRRFFYLVENMGRGNELAEISRQERQINEQAKAMAIKGRANALVMADIVKFFKACGEYASQCEITREPLTHAGFMLACGVKSRDTWSKMRNGDYNHLTYKYLIANDLPLSILDTPDVDIVQYTDDNGQIHEIPLVSMADIVQKCDLLIQAQLEQNCYTNKGNPAGSIFGLKARFGWQDSPQSVGTVNNTLVIADKEQAIKALEMLK